MGSLVFDLLLLGAVSLFTKKKETPYNGYTSMEPLAFDVLHEQAREQAKGQLNNNELTGDIHRDIIDDGGPDW